jgi:2,5-dihydroxypyridine 5,6-dioxygenase
MTDMVLHEHWIDSFAAIFERCKIGAAEKVILLSETGSRADNIEIAKAALGGLGISFTEISVPTPVPTAGPIITSTGASLALDNLPEVVAELCAADVIIDITIEGPMHARATPQILKSGARILNISNEHPDILARMHPDDTMPEKVKSAVKNCKSAKIMHVTHPGGTDLRIDMMGAANVGVWGWTDRPGTLAHWPGGLVVSFPKAGSTNGRIVFQPGDINLSFKRYFENSVGCDIADDFITKIDGQSTDAHLMRRYLSAFGDANAYATSHVGWGMNPQSRYEALTMYDKQDLNGTELRALAGNFLYSTGANEFAGRFTKGHFDLPMMGCTISLDGIVVVENGALI